MLAMPLLLVACTTCLYIYTQYTVSHPTNMQCGVPPYMKTANANLRPGNLFLTLEILKLSIQPIWNASNTQTGCKIVIWPTMININEEELPLPGSVALVEDPF
jgi:hypothetical protein